MKCVPTLALAAAALALLVAASAAFARGHHDGPPISMPGEITGKVIHVDDGDTLTLLAVDKSWRVIRLSDIDAPEVGHGSKRPGQPYGRQAGGFLRDFVLGKQARATCYDVDRRMRDDGTTRDRYVCKVFVGGIDANLALIDAGLAMAARQNKRYVRDPATYAHEDAAKAQRRGLWAQPVVVAPWEWRRRCWGHARCDSVDDHP